MQPFVDIAGAAWRAASAANQAAHADTAIHASQIRECPRALHYRAQGVPHSDTVPVGLNIKAHWGTAVHEFYLPYLAEQWRCQAGVADVQVEPELTVKHEGRTLLIAHPDLVVFFTDGTALVWELKTTGKPGVDAALGGEPKTAHLDQCRISAALVENEHGTPITGYVIYYLDRAEPERHWAMVDRSWTDSAVSTASALIAYAMTVATDLAAAPRWFGRHESDAAAPFSPCLSCPWQTQCLGKGPDGRISGEAAGELVAAGGEANVAVKDAEERLAQFMRLKADIKDAKRGKTRLTDLVAALDIEPGTYRAHGVEHTLVWREGHLRTDEEACARMLTNLGKTVPKKPVSGYFQFK